MHEIIIFLNSMEKGIDCQDLQCIGFIIELQKKIHNKDFPLFRNRSRFDRIEIS